MIAALGFCGLAIVGFAFWNYQLSGKNDELLEQRRRMELELDRQEKEVEFLLERNRQLIENVTQLAAQVPRHDALGRFKKKALQR